MRTLWNLTIFHFNNTWMSHMTRSYFQAVEQNKNNWIFLDIKYQKLETLDFWRLLASFLPSFFPSFLLFATRFSSTPSRIECLESLHKRPIPLFIFNGFWILLIYLAVKKADESNRLLQLNLPRNKECCDLCKFPTQIMSRTSLMFKANCERKK